jgi:hypothetical protein
MKNLLFFSILISSICLAGTLGSNQKPVDNGRSVKEAFGSFIENLTENNQETSSAASAPNQQTKSATEIDAIQTRIYESSYKNVFRSVLSVLQDNHFKIEFTDYNVGVISATGDTITSSNANDIAASQLSIQAAGMVIPFVGALSAIPGFNQEQEQATFSISTDIEENSENLIKVRLIITAKVTGQKGYETVSRTEDMTSYPEFYQSLFAKIDTKIFVRENTE